MTADGCVVLLSGGQDSTVVLFWAKQKFKHVHALTILYGQAHKVEIEAAKKIAALAEVPHEILHLPEGILKGSPLVGEGEIPSEVTEGVAPTFVPGRNALFLTIAANRAFVKGFRNIAFGANQIDYSGYPDCRSVFVTIQEAALSQALGVQNFRIHTPLLWLRKYEIISLAQDLGCFDMFAYTHTCYRGEVPPCMNCPACKIRAEGFERAGVEDPLIVRLRKEGKL